MKRYLFLGGPVHAQVRTLVRCSSAAICVNGKFHDYKMVTFRHPVRDVEYDIMVRGDVSLLPPAMVIGLLALNGME